MQLSINKRMKHLIYLNMDNVIKTMTHRSGWKYALESISFLSNKKGVLLEDFIEKTFGWNWCGNIRDDESKDVYYNEKHYNIQYKNIKLLKGCHLVKLNDNLYIIFSKNMWIKYDEPMNDNMWNNLPLAYKNIVYKEDWIGFLHHPPNIPEWFDYQNSLQELLKREEFLESLKYCKGIFVLSDYLNDWLSRYFYENNIHVKINTLYHPTEIPDKKFSWSEFKKNKNKKIIQNGYWLRSMTFIWELQLRKDKLFDYGKVWLYGALHAFDCILKELKNTEVRNKEELITNFKKIVDFTSNGEFINTKVKDVEIKRISNEEYDTLLSNNICVLYLYDSSCNNAIIECMARNTPIIVNKIPAVVEYLGENYPLYFNTIEEAQDLLYNKKLLKKGYKYLKKMNKNKISRKTFRNELLNSEIYKDLISIYKNTELDMHEDFLEIFKKYFYDCFHF